MQSATCIDHVWVLLLPLRYQLFFSISSSSVQLSFFHRRLMAPPK